MNKKRTHRLAKVKPSPVRGEEQGGSGDVVGLSDQGDALAGLGAMASFAPVGRRATD